ncbi:MAG: TIGR03745 family integrating conjugative element membrane protein [Gammaproteobacteria bacterium]|nr:TIGR03745 family integrating conjugative element membrane protein [Gammaproteobacteria bacterium]
MSLRKTLTSASALYLSLCQTAFAVLPTAPASVGGASSSGSVLDWFKGLAKEGGVILGLVLAVAAFSWVAWGVIADVHAARTGRKEWGEVGFTGIIGAVVLLFVTYLLGVAANIIDI